MKSQIIALINSIIAQANEQVGVLNYAHVKQDNRLAGEIFNDEQIVDSRISQARIRYNALLAEADKLHTETIAYIKSTYLDKQPSSDELDIATDRYDELQDQFEAAMLLAKTVGVFQDQSESYREGEWNFPKRPGKVHNGKLEFFVDGIRITGNLVDTINHILKLECKGHKDIVLPDPELIDHLMLSAKDQLGLWRDRSTYYATNIHGHSISAYRQ